MKSNNKKKESITKVCDRFKLDEIIKIFYDNVPKYFNNFVRDLNYFINRINENTGHSKLVHILAISTLIIIIFGPTANIPLNISNDEELIVLTFSLVITLYLSTCLILAGVKFRGSKLHNVHCIILISSALVVFCLPDKYIEASGLPFPHVYAGIVIILMLLTIISRYISTYVFKYMLKANDKNSASLNNEEENKLINYAIQIGKLLHDKNTELMVNFQVPPQYTRSRVYSSLISPLSRNFLLTLFVPALLILIFPFLGKWSALISLVLVVIIFSWGMYYSRWDLLISTLNRWFMTGGPKILSITVIVIAIAKLLNVHYVTTVLESGPIKSLLFSAYIIFWLYKYWINRFFYEKMLLVLNTGYNVEIDRPWSIDVNNQKITLLGDSEFVVKEKTTSVTSKYLIYMPNTLLDQIVYNLSDKEKNVSMAAVREIKNKVISYFSFLNFFLTTIAVLLVCYLIFFKPPKPLVFLKEKDVNQAQYVISSSKVDDDSILVRKLKIIAGKKNKNAVLIAASGGGTRAALFTTSLLCGLNEIDIDKDNIALISSVSGGSAASAYYACNLSKLNKSCKSNHITKKLNNHWQKFYNIMSIDYIDEVLRGTVEKRVFFREQNGILLMESFKRHFGNVAEIGNINEFGLIFNTTLTGHPYYESKNLTELYCKNEKIRCSDKLYKLFSGSRLIITNLPSSLFPYEGPEYEKDKFLFYKTINNKFDAKIDLQYESVPLFAAASLSANFPPIFSDSGLEIITDRSNGRCNGQYWITDGGAMDNRGLLSLLYSLREAVKKINKNELPKLHIIVADASFESIDYIQEKRGIGGKLDSSVHLASEISNELFEDINRYICDLKGENYDKSKSSFLKMYYLEMPKIFRTRGGLGTHWKMPQNIVFSDPKEFDQKDAKTEDLKKHEVLNLIANLHGKGDCKKRLEKSFNKNIVSWICNDDKHQEVWSKITNNLK